MKMYLFQNFKIKQRFFKKISNNVFLFFMSVELKMFLGYAKVTSDIKPISHF